MNITNINLLLTENKRKIEWLEEDNKEPRPYEILNLLIKTNHLLRLKSKIIMMEYHISKNGLSGYQNFSYN